MCWWKYLTTVPLGGGATLICRICQFPCWKSSHHSWFQAVNVMSLNAESRRDVHSCLSREAEPAGTAPTVEHWRYPLSHQALALASKRKPPDQAGTCHGRTRITQTEPTNVYLINRHSVVGDSSITLLEALRTQSWSPKPRFILTFLKSALQQGKAVRHVP